MWRCRCVVVFDFHDRRNEIVGSATAPAAQHPHNWRGNFNAGPRLKPQWATQGIFVTHELTNWDVLSSVSNGELVEKIVVRKSQSPQTLVVVSNFSGFLVSTNKMKDAQPQLAELFKFASGLMNAAVWIEPATSAATKGLIPWLKSVLGKWSLFAKLIGHHDADGTCECKFELPAKPGMTAMVRLCVLPIELVRQNA